MNDEFLDEDGAGTLEETEEGGYQDQWPVHCRRVYWDFQPGKALQKPDFDWRLIFFHALTHLLPKIDYSRFSTLHTDLFALPDMKYWTFFCQEHSDQPNKREEGEDPGGSVYSELLKCQHPCEHQDAAHVLTR